MLLVTGQVIGILTHTDGVLKLDTYSEVPCILAPGAAVLAVVDGVRVVVGARLGD